MSKVSIIVPTYNRSNYLSLALESILNQSYKNIEIIVSDNSSSDNTEEMISNIKDERLRYFKNSENLGVVKNHNLALQKCTGDYIHIFSDDDIMLPRCIEDKVNIFKKNPNVGLVHSNIKIINSKGEIIKQNHWGIDDKKNGHILNVSGLSSSSKMFSILYYDWNIISMPSVMIRKKVIDDIGLFSTNTLYLCDWDLWLRITKKYDFYYLNNFLILYRIHDTNVYQLTNKKINLKELKLMKQNYHAKNMGIINKFKIYYYSLIQKQK